MIQSFADETAVDLFRERNTRSRATCLRVIRPDGASTQRKR